MSDERSLCYAALEEHFLRCGELRAVPVVDNGEPMVSLGANFSGKIFAHDALMRGFTGDEIFVRAALVDRLETAHRRLKEIRPDWDLQVVYGYRHLDVQIEKFEAQKAKVLAASPDLTGEALDETVHHFIAVPDVAGHPTGGAVDVRPVDQTGVPAPMGTAISDYTPDTYVFSPFISREAWRNRQILRACMLQAGFAPFDGEWWHFSFGDREWACYYRRPNALYTQVRFSSVR